MTECKIVPVVQTNCNKRFPCTPHSWMLDRHISNGLLGLAWETPGATRSTVAPLSLLPFVTRNATQRVEMFPSDQETPNIILRFNPAQA